MTYNISDTVQDRDMVRLELSAICQMMSFSMTLSDPSRSGHSSTANNSKMVQCRESYITMVDCKKVVYDLSNSPIFNDLE